MKTFIIITLAILPWSGTIDAQLTNSGNIRTFTGANVTIYGDVTNNGIIADSATLITLAGSALQTFGGSSVTTLKNLRLNNSSATGVTLAQALNIRGTLTFTDGYLNTTAANILTFTSSAAASGASNNSFVSGPAIKTGNSAFVFPMGKNAVYAPIAISAPAVTTDQFTAEYFQNSPNTAAYITWSLEPTLHHISECEYWILDRTTGSSSVSVTLSWDTPRSCGITLTGDLRVARWDGLQWTDQGNGGTTGTTTSGTIVTSAPVTTFSPFTLASTTPMNPLPVELVSFTAQCEKEQIVLRWSTASEFNNDFFTLESSLDALNWETITTVDAVGTSSIQTNYSWTNSTTPVRNVYYRLSQTDNNTTTTIHDMVYLENCQTAETLLEIYPNPTKSTVTILMEETLSGINVLNPEGKVVGNIPVDLQNKQVRFDEMPNGVYTLRISTPGRTFHQKVVVMRD